MIDKIPKHGEILKIETKDRDYIVVFLLQNVELGKVAEAIWEFRPRDYAREHIYLDDSDKTPRTLEKINADLAQLYIKINYKPEETKK